MHNLNGLMEHIQWRNSFNMGDAQVSRARTPIFSSSTALGSGSILNIGRVLDYIDYTSEDADYAM